MYFKNVFKHVGHNLTGSSPYEMVHLKTSFSHLYTVIDYSIVITSPLHQSLVRKMSSINCYMIEIYNARHHFPYY